jgi:hypothetical protein
MTQVTYDKLLGQPLLHRHDPLRLKDSNGVFWDITVSVAGALVVTQVSTNAGMPMGLLLSLTYSN